MPDTMPQRRGPVPTRMIDGLPFCPRTGLPTSLCDCADRFEDEPLQPFIDSVVRRHELVLDEAAQVWRHPSGHVPTIHPAGQPIQPKHQHEIRPEWIEDGDVWLPISDARHLADSCAGCAWQVHVHAFVAKHYGD